MGDINQAGLDLVKKWEGFYPNAYDDGEGVWTIGFGTVRWDMKTPVKKGDTITKEEAERQLIKEMQRVEDAIDASVTAPINPNEYASFCAIFYNIGIGWCTGHGHQQATFIKDFNRGRKDLVPGGMLKFVHGANSGKAYQGLLNRRRDEVKLFLTPVEAEAPHPEDKPIPEVPMPQAVAPKPVSTIQVAKDSQTVKVASGGILAALLQGWAWLTGAVKDAGPEIVSNQQALSPFDALFKAMKANVGGLMAIIVIASLVVVIIRRINQERA